jgi:hypothetical protein
MEKEINVNDWLTEAKEVPSTINLIEFNEFKNYNQIKRGLSIRVLKSILMTNPTGYQNLFNDVQKTAKLEGIIMSFVDAGDAFILTFK